MRENEKIAMKFGLRFAAILAVGLLVGIALIAAFDETTRHKLLNDTGFLFYTIFLFVVVCDMWGCGATLVKLVSITPPASRNG